MSRVFDAMDVAAAQQPTLEVRAQQFENFLARWLLPLVGGNAYLAAILRLHELCPAVGWWLGGVAAVVGGGLLAFIITRRRDAGVLAATAASSLAIAFLAVLPAPLGTLVVGLAPAAYAIALVKGSLSGSGSSLFFLQLPIVSAVLLEVPSVVGATAVILALLGAATILIASARYRFGGSALAAGALVGALTPELQGTVLWTTLVALLCVGAAAYEWRLDRRWRSDLRRATGQGLSALLLLLLASLLPTGLPIGVLWTVLVGALQLIQAYREHDRDPVRLSWPAIALVAALWLTDGLGGWAVRTAATCAIVAGLHVVAVGTRSRYVWTLAVVLLLGPVGVTLSRAGASGFDPQLLLVEIVVTALLLALGSGPQRWARTLPWWRGFISAEHWATLRALKNNAVTTLETAAFVGPAFKALRMLFGMLSYVTGSDTGLLHDAVYAGANVYGAAAFAAQLTALMVAAGSPWSAAHLASEIAWMAWGFGLLLVGTSRNDILSRYLGLALVCVPAVETVRLGELSTDVFEIALIAATGAALAGYAAARAAAAHAGTAPLVTRQLPPSPSPPS